MKLQVPRFSVRLALLVPAAFAVLCALAVGPLKRYLQGRDDDRAHAACRANLRAIAAALNAYHAEYGCLPPAYTVDAAGRRLLSWRVLILPHLGRSDLSSRFDHREPWDGPRNLPLVDRMPGEFACPAHPEAAARGRTAYKAPVGSDTLFPGRRPARLSEITYPWNHPLMVVEVLNDEVPWSAPLDLEVEGLPPPSGGDPTDPRTSLAYPARGGALGRHHAGEPQVFPNGVELSEYGANGIWAPNSICRDKYVLKKWFLWTESSKSRQPGIPDY